MSECQIPKLSTNGQINWTVLKVKITNRYDKIFTIFSHQKNVNQSYNEILKNVGAVTNTNFVQTTIEISIQFPQNTENRNNHLTELMLKLVYNRDTCTSMFIMPLF